LRLHREQARLEAELTEKHDAQVQFGLEKQRVQTSKLHGRQINTFDPIIMLSWHKSQVTMAELTTWTSAWLLKQVGFAFPSD